MYTVNIRLKFSAAHRLRGYRGRCEKLHGHNWVVEVSAASCMLDKAGMVVDFSELKAGVRKVLDGMDHKFLNELTPFKNNNPTSENIAAYIYGALKNFCRRRSLSPVRVTVWETEANSASYEE